ncbi:hypothetical protein [Campylobacter sp. MIT 97-5078]|uniref:hypothetical protein n=1 Tax=Campylobacter sp. MIT 97-5078 TaxID=1548153 RepID=UPI000513ACBA|nr:hypothetical protein [Campylobacter sp. MIT 97-5078]KGI55896.1 hypothetical protein LR59_09890 [Campylobacter sp. MIT 97-5078]KGI57778.1 hypothetical protein LR59_03650 [Campylobacter sp. MIT 97-5078]TQR23071.1 hypothetical protein DMB91_08300 [Campylobacter sp. MIT 97-5078]
MHGKIMVYMDSTGRGTVMNLAKVFFDFNRQNWHDKKSMPSAGVFVEFNADGKRITSLKPSKYQEFKEDSFITEQDFWRTDSDDALEDMQNSRRSAYITQLFRTTDFDSIDHIPLSMTIPQAIQKYFEGEILSVEALKVNMENNDKEAPCILDFFIIKRFLNKAFDTLIFMDNSINQTQFATLKSITMHLENSFNDMRDKQKLLNTTRIFNEIFLSVQCHYQALVATIDTRKNRLASNEHQLRTAQTEMRLLTSKPKPDPDKIKIKQDRMDELVKEITYFKETLTRLEALRNDFYKKNLSLFENAFKLSREKLFQKIITGLNLCATIMDTKIWSVALKSSGVKNSYFSRNNTEHSFCTLSFAELYLSRLDKASLNPSDQKLYAYLQKINKEHGKKFLVVTSDLELLTKIKIQVFTLNPYFIVKYAPKKVNYQSLMRDNTFDMVYIDEKTAWENAADIILEGKHFDKYGKTKFKLI